MIGWMKDVASPSSTGTSTERKLRAIVRLALYPLALALIALAWKGRQVISDSSGGPPQVRWQGVTSQGQKINAVTVDGFLVSLDTHLIERCANGSRWTLHWNPRGPSR